MDSRTVTTERPEKAFKARTAQEEGSTIGRYLYYPGTRRLRRLEDGREVFQAFVFGQWRMYYEVPLDATDLGRIRGRLATTGRAR